MLMTYSTRHCVCVFVCASRSYWIVLYAVWHQCVFVESLFPRLSKGRGSLQTGFTRATTRISHGGILSVFAWDVTLSILFVSKVSCDFHCVHLCICLNVSVNIESQSPHTFLLRQYSAGLRTEQCKFSKEECNLNLWRHRERVCGPWNRFITFLKSPLRNVCF